MTVRLCDIELPIFSPTPSPFSAVIGLEYWDGMLTGLAWCYSEETPYRFEVVCWDPDEMIRVVAFAPARHITLEQAYKLLEPIGKPRGAEWVPSPDPRNDIHRSAIESLEFFRAREGPPLFVVAAENFAKQLLRASTLDKVARERVPSSWKMPTDENWSFWKTFFRI